MRLRTESEVCFSGDEKTYRQSRTMVLVRALVVGGAFAGAGPLWIYLGAPWIVPAICILFALFAVPYFIRDCYSAWRSNNWLMRLDRGRIWLNMRSYSHYNFEPSATVIETACQDIESVCKERSRYVGPMDVRPGTVRATTMVTLRIRFHQPIPTQIVESLRAERRRLVAHRYFGIFTISGRSHDDLVSVADDHTLTILWLSQNVSIHPRIDDAIARLRQEGVAVETAETHEWLWSSLALDDQDQMIAELENRGRVLEAKRLKARQAENREQALASL